MCQPRNMESGHQLSGAHDVPNQSGAASALSRHSELLAAMSWAHSLGSQASGPRLTLSTPQMPLPLFKSLSQVLPDAIHLTSLCSQAHIAGMLYCLAMQGVTDASVCSHHS